jgi:hypothetical protein
VPDGAPSMETRFALLLSEGVHGEVLVAPGSGALR